MQPTTVQNAGREFRIDEKYSVSIASNPGFLFLQVGQEYGNTKAHFDHPNILAACPRIFEYKHYQSKRGKWWTQKAGITFYFAIPTNKIVLLPEKGYSYVPVEINGQKINLNVSGGGNGEKGWVDLIRLFNSAPVGLPVRTMKALAEIALPPEKVKQEGFEITSKLFDYFHTNPERKNTFTALVAEQEVKGNLEVGSKVVLGYRYSVCGKQGPFEIVHKPCRKRHFYSDCGTYYHRTKIYYKHVDWVKTALENGFSLVDPDNMGFNRLSVQETVCRTTRKQIVSYGCR